MGYLADSSRVTAVGTGSSPGILARLSSCELHGGCEGCSRCSRSGTKKVGGRNELKSKKARTELPCAQIRLPKSDTLVISLNRLATSTTPLQLQDAVAWYIIEVHCCIAQLRLYECDEKFKRAALPSRLRLLPAKAFATNFPQGLTVSLSSFVGGQDEKQDSGRCCDRATTIREA